MENVTEIPYSHKLFSALWQIFPSSILVLQDLKTFVIFLKNLLKEIVDDKTNTVNWKLDKLEKNIKQGNK